MSEDQKIVWNDIAQKAEFQDGSVINMFVASGSESYAQKVSIGKNLNQVRIIIRYVG